MTQKFGHTVEHKADRQLGGDQWIATFNNGFGASVIRNRYSYGGPEGRYEVAVLHGEPLCYATTVTDDVIGWLSAQGVRETLDRIAVLESKPNCSHKAAA